jgi:hypothetical protein
MSSIDKNLAIGVTVAAVVIFAASFLPWCTIRRTGTLNLPFVPKGTDVPDLFGEMEVEFTVTGWYGNLLLRRLELPNWLVVVAAIGWRPCVG